MARTHQRKTSRGKGARDPRRPASVRPSRLPDHRKKRPPRGGLGSRILRVVGIFFLCVLVAGVAFAAGGYLGVIKGVERLGEPQNFETHPTYIYSAPLGGNEDSRRVIGTIFQGQNRKTASLDGDAAAPAQRAGRQGGRALQGARRGGPLGHHAALWGGHPGRRGGRGGEHHHPAVRQERLPLPGPVHHAQGQRSPDRHRDRAQEGIQRPDHRRLPEHRLLRQQRLRGRRPPPRPTSTSPSRT